MKTIYLDCFAGIAGDMFIGALLNLVPSDKILRDGLKKLKALAPEEYELVIERGVKNSIAGINFDVITHEHSHHHDHEEHEHEHEHSHYHIHDHEHAEHEHHHHEGCPHAHEHEHSHNHIHDELNEHDHEHEHGEHSHVHRHLADIEKMIFESELSDRVKREAIRAFSLLAEAEAHVHGTTPDKIHFHEVGAVDSIIDIVGAFILMEALDWPRVLSSPVNVGSGTVTCAHGILPVPAPATEFLLHGLPVFSKGEPMERTTPTGALLLRILADGFTQDVPPGKICASGFGLGNRTSPDMPNVLRVLLLECSTPQGLTDTGNKIINEYDGLVHEKLVKLECNIDDMNAQDFEPVTEKLFKAGALDVWTESIYMKKGRPAVKFCCLAKPDNVKEFVIIILKNTSSQGVRLIDINRARLNWRIEKFKSSLGEINIKVTFINDEVIRKVPEYEDLKRLAGLNNLSMFEVRNLINKEI